MVARAAVVSLGHSCVTAPDGDAAWRLFCATKPDVVVTDRNMPGLDGVALCRAIRAADNGSYTYLVLLTSLGDDEHILSGMQAGADDYLAKPLNPLQLAARLLAAQRVTTLHAELSRHREQLAVLAETDPLTGMRNRLRLPEELAGLHQRSQRYRRDYSLALLDVDLFKGYNDTYGHQAGDLALQTVAKVLGCQLRADDWAYRYGGEEFLLVLPEQSGALSFAAVERLRGVVEALGIEHAGTGHGVLTLSAGVSTFSADRPITTEGLLKEADLALYAAKAAGRNTVMKSALPSH